jgi:hypothetical protein
MSHTLLALLPIFCSIEFHSVLFYDAVIRPRLNWLCSHLHAST